MKPNYVKKDEPLDKTEDILDKMNSVWPTNHQHDMSTSHTGSNQTNGLFTFWHMNSFGIIRAYSIDSDFDLAFFYTCIFSKDVTCHFSI